MDLKPVTQWTFADIEAWVNGFDASATAKAQLIGDLGKLPTTGEELIHISCKNDLNDLNGISALLKNKLWKEIQILQSIHVIELEGESKDELTERLLAEQMEFQRQSPEWFDENAEPGNGFFIQFQSSKGTTNTTKRRFQKTDKIRKLEQAIVDMEEGGDLDKLTLTFNSKPLKSGKTIGYYNITGSSNIIVTFKVKGGSIDVNSDAYLEKNKKKNTNKQRTRLAHFQSEKRITPTLEPDCIMGYDEKSLRVKMPCGHVYDPLTIFKIAESAIRRHGITDIYCPMLKCKQLWNFDVVAAAGDLSIQERHNFESIFKNRIAFKNGECVQCEHCKTFVSRPPNLKIARVTCTQESCKTKGDFCYQCLKPWKSNGSIVCGNKGCNTEDRNKLLQNCDVTITITAHNGVPVPKIRACPTCYSLNEYESACKHTKCWKCGCQFCFVCLEVGHKEGFIFRTVVWHCKSGQRHDGKCEVTPRQVL